MDILDSLLPNKVPHHLMPWDLTKYSDNEDGFTGEHLQKTVIFTLKAVVFYHLLAYRVVCPLITKYTSR